MVPMKLARISTVKNMAGKSRPGYRIKQVESEVLRTVYGRWQAFITRPK